MRTHLYRSGRLPLDGAVCLVADDDPAIRRLLRRMLERAGARVEVREDAGDLVKDVRELQPDILLLDYDMPDIDGLRACMALRAHEDMSLLPVVIITGKDDQSLHLDVIRAGADDLIRKPLQRELLLARVSNLVLRHRTERDNRRLVAKLESYVSEPARDLKEERHQVERLTAAVLFSDLRGFTATSFEQDLDRVFHAVSAVLARQTEIVTDCAGYTDKFSGDGLLAVFQGPDGSSNACEAARQIVRWAREFDLIAFWNPPPIGFGVHHGEFLRGDMGGPMRREFTVLGHTVNIAARLCGIAGPLDVRVSQSVVDLVDPDFHFDAGELRNLKGMPPNSRVYRLLDD